MRARRLVFVVAVSAFLTLEVGLLQAAPSTFTSCQSTDHRVPKTQVPGAGRELVPRGTTGVLLCRYRGLNPLRKRFRLLASHQVTRASTVAHLRAQLNALPSGPAGPVACPADDGSLIVAFFHYAGAADDVVSVETSGCELVSNGHVNRWAEPAPQLETALAALTR